MLGFCYKYDNPKSLILWCGANGLYKQGAPCIIEIKPNENTSHLFMNNYTLIFIIFLLLAAIFTYLRRKGIIKGNIEDDDD